MNREVPRKLATVAEFEELPTGLVLVDNTNHAWVKGATQWWSSHPYDQGHHNNPMKMRWVALVYLPGMIPE